MKTTIIYVTPPQAPAEYLNWDAEPTKIVGIDTRCQRGTGNQFFLVRSVYPSKGEVYLFEQTGQNGTYLMGQAWTKDEYGWQLCGEVTFNPKAWYFEEVEAVFDYCNGQPIADSVTVVRP